jgi:hypothetical protein
MISQMHFMENKDTHGGEEKLEADLTECTPDSPYTKVKNWISTGH